MFENGEKARYRALLAANGHHWDPCWPELPFPSLPKYILGKPLDQLTPPSWVPFPWQMQLLRFAIRLQVGKLTEYGLSQPDHKALHTYPTVNLDFTASDGFLKPS